MATQTRTTGLWDLWVWSPRSDVQVPLERACLALKCSRVGVQKGPPFNRRALLVCHRLAGGLNRESVTLHPIVAEDLGQVAPAGVGEDHDHEAIRILGGDP